VLPLIHRVAFLALALISGVVGLLGFNRVVQQIRMGAPDAGDRTSNLPRRVFRALSVTLTQSRTFRKRPVVNVFHSFIFYGFVFYILVNAVDAAEGFFPIGIRSTNPLGAAYNLAADILSALVLLGVVALVVRRFLRVDHAFDFNPRTLLHPRVTRGAIRLDSAIVSAFIFIHVGSRALGAAAKLRLEPPDSFQPFASLLAHGIPLRYAQPLELIGYWGALGSILLFLGYFPYTKHIHIFAAPAKYLFARAESSGTLPLLDLESDAGSDYPGAGTMGQLSWPRLLDAYACIQCNRCQDVCPATTTGKSLSPAALEINKRMLFNERGSNAAGVSLLSAVINEESLWACTTCGACMQACPVQDEQMLDIVEIRRHQVMTSSHFPQQLQSAFRGMERAQNPWGIGRERRMEWAVGLNVRTIEENPRPDILYWVGCSASYDPQAQSIARSFVRLLDHAGVNFAVLGNSECCTGDSARRAGNEFLYQQLAKQSISALNRAAPKRIVASCPHCMNALRNEFPQLGGNYEVVHHSQYLDELAQQGRLELTKPSEAARITFHDPCYLGRHNGVYDAPRNVLRILGQDLVEMERAREDSFCCGAGGAQFWKEEEPGEERIATNRLREARALLGAQGGVVAVGCPFCKNMLSSDPAEDTQAPIIVRDIAELLAERIESATPEPRLSPAPPTAVARGVAELAAGAAATIVEAARDLHSEPILQDVRRDAEQAAESTDKPDEGSLASTSAPKRKEWRPAAIRSTKQPKISENLSPGLTTTEVDGVTNRQASGSSSPSPSPLTVGKNRPSAEQAGSSDASASPNRKVWNPKPRKGS
jgi:Fe-S oxidoreductase